MLDPLYSQLASAVAPWIVPAVLLGLLTIPVGLVMVAWVGRRRFQRRNFAGVEEFRSYSHAVGSNLIESVVAGFGAILVSVGAFTIGFVIWAMFIQRY